MALLVCRLCFIKAAPRMHFYSTHVVCRRLPCLLILSLISRCPLQSADIIGSSSAQETLLKHLALSAEDAGYLQCCCRYLLIRSLREAIKGTGLMHQSPGHNVFCSNCLMPSRSHVYLDSKCSSYN